jgi:hypothetical protein
MDTKQQHDAQEKGYDTTKMKGKATMVSNG